MSNVRSCAILFLLAVSIGYVFGLILPFLIIGGAIALFISGAKKKEKSNENN